jgi:lipid-A-disaccharide synthase
MKYYIIAGEASGDLHASNLMRELKAIDANAKFRCWGGDLMKSQGGELVKHYKELAFMGFTEVLLNIRTIFKNINFCKKDISEFKPDVIILVDYPGFNLRIAGFAKEKGFKVFYYISPQVWAWKQSRVHKIKRIVDRMFVILPFEEDFYKKFNYKVDFVGHPLLDAVDSQSKSGPSFNEFVEKNNLEEKSIVALLPGSRMQEISTMLPLMLSIKKSFPDHQFVIAAAPSVPLSFYENLMKGSDAKVIFNQTYELLRHAEAAMVTSGTATLETSLFNVPEVVCYKGSAISFFIARKLVKVKYISLVNLIMDKEIVKELIQSELNEINLKNELEKLLHDKVYRETMLENFSVLRSKLGGIGASAKTARLMIDYLSEK